MILRYPAVLGLILALSFFKEVSAAASQEESIGSPRAPIAHLNMEQQQLLSDLDLGNFETGTSIKKSAPLTIQTVEESLVGNMIFTAVRNNQVIRNEDGQFQMELVFGKGSAWIDITNWRQHIRTIIDEKQHYSLLMGGGSL